MTFLAASRTCWKVPYRVIIGIVPLGSTGHGKGQFLFSPSKDKQLNTVDPDQATSSGDPVESVIWEEGSSVEKMCRQVCEAFS